MPAIPFVTFNTQTDQYSVDDAACRFLQTLKGPIGVVSIAGKYRTGKSLFLNRVILNERPGSGFNVGSTINACTKGLWIHSKTITCTSPDGKPMQVVVMDSEGIGSLDASSTHDCRIFSLALLLSSFFVYNSVGSIDDTTLKTLSLVTNISKQVRIQSDKTATPEELAALFPSFCWVVRDFTLRLEDMNGDSINSNTYLEKALDTKSESDETEQVKKVIKECFPNRRCVTMVRPCQEESDLQDLDNMSNKKLRPIFVSQMDDIRGMIRSNVKPKTFMDTPVSGNMLATMAKTFTKSINEGAAPVIKDSWDMISEIQGRELVDSSVEAFEYSIQQYNVVGKLLSTELLTEKLNVWYTNILSSFKTNSMVQNVTCTKKLISRLKTIQSKSIVDNEITISRCMEKVLNMLKDDVDVITDVAELRPTFKKRTDQLFTLVDRSNSVVGRWSSLKIPFIWKYISRITSERADHIKTLEEERDMSEKIVKGLRLQIKESQDDFDQANKNHEESMMKLRKEYTHMIGDKEQRFTAERKEMSDQLTTTMTRVKKMEERVMNVTDEYSTKLQDKSTQLTNSEAKLGVVTEEVVIIKQECEDLQQLIDELKEEVKSDGCLRLQLVEMEQQLETANNTVAQLKVSVKNNEIRFKQFVDEMNKESVETIERLKNGCFIEKEKYTTALATHEADIQTVKNELTGRVSTLTSELKSCRSELQRVKQISSDSQKRYETEVNTLTSTNDQLVKQVKEERDSYVLDINKVRQEYSGSKKALDAEYRVLQDKFMDNHMKSTTRVRELETSLTCSNVELEGCKRRLAEVDEEAGSRKKMKLDLHKAQSELERRRSVSEWLEKDKAIKEQRISDLNKTVSKLEKRVHEEGRQHEMALLKMKMAFENR